MKAGKILGIILATVCCVLIFYFAPQAVHPSEGSLKSEVQTQDQLPATLLPENAAFSQFGYSVNFSFSFKKGFEVVEYFIWAICQIEEYFFKVNSEFLKRSINYFIHHQKATLIFPFHHFW